MYFFVLSDIHANAAALEAVLEKIRLLALPIEETRYIFLGDLLGYGPVTGALDCLKWAQQMNGQAFWLAGNHDEWLLRLQGSLSKEAMVTLLAQRKYLQRPEHLVFWNWYEKRIEALTQPGEQGLEENSIIHISIGTPSTGALALVGTHGGVQPGARRLEYEYPWEPTIMHANLLGAQQIAAPREPCLLYGHTHYPVYAQMSKNGICFLPISYGRTQPLLGNTTINPGSVGQPRDGDPRAAFVMIDSDNLTVTFYRVPYDLEKVKMGFFLEKSPNYQKHPLTPAERNAVLHEIEMGISEKGDGKQNPVMVWEEAYQELIERTEKANGKGNLVRYQAIYSYDPQTETLQVKSNSCQE